MLDLLILLLLYESKKRQCKPSISHLNGINFSSLLQSTESTYVKMLRGKVLGFIDDDC